MRSLLFILSLILLTLLFACSNNSKNQIIVKPKKDKSIFQKSYQHAGESDSIVLTSTDTSEDASYNKISIFRKKKLIFEYADKDLQILGMAYSIFVEHEIKFPNEYFYIFKLFNAPSPDKYLIIKTSLEKTALFGITEPNSAQIFGDVDNDGKFEIGGWSDYGQEDETHKGPDLKQYKVFEIADGFPIDTTLTNYFRKFIAR